MSYLLKQLKKIDKDKIAGDVLSSEELNSYKIIREDIEDENSWAIDDTSGNYLLRITRREREEWDNVNYLLYFNSHFFRIRKLSVSRSNDVSFQKYPKSLEPVREEVAIQFKMAIRVFGKYGYGPDGKSFGKNYPGQTFDPNFLEDDIIPESM
jgi:hypothetical protein